MPQTEKLHARPKPKKRLATPALSPPKGKPPSQDFPPVAICLYGPSGIGKSSMFAYWPKPGFVVDHHEDGIEDLVQWKQAPKPVFVKQFGGPDDEKKGKAWEKMLEYLWQVASGKFGIKTLVVETLTGMQQLCFNYHCQRYFDGDWSKEGFYNYQQGPVNAAQRDWPEFIDALKGVWEAGIHVVVTAHSQVKTVPNPEGKDFDKYLPFLQKDIWQAIHRWCKTLLLYKMEVDVEGRGRQKGKGVAGSERRIIYTTPSVFWDAKNRYGLPDLIPAGESPREAAEALLAALRKASKQVGV